MYNNLCVKCDYKHKVNKKSIYRYYNKDVYRSRDTIICIICSWMIKINGLHSTMAYQVVVYNTAVCTKNDENGVSYWKYLGQIFSRWYRIVNRIDIVMKESMSRPHVLALGKKTKYLNAGHRCWSLAQRAHLAGLSRSSARST